MSHALPSSKKTHSERHKQILKQLLKEDANRTCVDCKTAAHPRWASWNLGCFICIRCSGIHRSMGVHISKVKSVDLDAWTDPQVESMVKWGNAKCNAYWEAKLPDGYVPDQSKIENFIRTKYDLKKWVASPTVPDPMSLAGSSSVKPAAAPAPAPAPKPSHKPSSHSHNLLEDDFGSFTSASKPAVPAKPKAQPSLTKVPIQSSPSGLTSSQSTGGSMNGRPDLKKSILSLYSSPSSSSSSFIQPQQPQRADTSGLSNSLSGLNFGSSPQVTPSSMAFNSTASINSSPAASSSSATPSASQNWSNNWSDVPSGSKSTNSTVANPLDDDLFKNVWK